MRLQESINILFTSIKRLNVRMLLVRRYKLPYFAISNIKFPHGEKKGLPAIRHAVMLTLSAMGGFWTHI